MSKQIECWFSSEDGKRYKLSKQPDLKFADMDRTESKIFVDSEIKYQSILGIGSSLEESTVYNLSKLSDAESDEVLQKLFDVNTGIGWNLVRICFGSSDFTGRDYYSYCDIPVNSEDNQLKNFSIQKDIDYNIIPYLKKVIDINPDIKIIASPWSPPAWMKTSKNMCGGSLQHKYYETCAQYYRKAIQAYKDIGIPIYSMTLQNEPHMDNKTYPSCYFTWQEQQKFLTVIKEEFYKYDINTKLWILDHNFSMAMSFAAKILEDTNSFQYTDGIAFHDYDGEPTEMSDLHYRFPEKDIFLTERSTWGTKGIDRIIQYFRNWARSYNAWVACLDEQRQPNSGCHNADPTFVEFNNDNCSYSLIPEYYLIGQLSKFIKRGAYRIQSNYGSKDFVTNAAFLNQDNSIVLIIVNQNDTEKNFSVQYQDKQVNTAIPAKTVATYRWSL